MVVVVRVVVFNPTFNNISVISLRSVLLVEEIGVPGENHRPAASHLQTLSHNAVSSTPITERGLNSLNEYEISLKHEISRIELQMFKMEKTFLS